MHHSFVPLFGVMCGKIHMRNSRFYLRIVLVDFELHPFPFAQFVSYIIGPTSRR